MGSKPTTKKGGQLGLGNLCLSLGLRLVTCGIGRGEAPPARAVKGAFPRLAALPYDTTEPKRTNTD